MTFELMPLDLNLDYIRNAILNINFSQLPRFDFWSIRDQIHLNLRFPRIVPFSIISSLALMYLFALWLALVWWVNQDVKQRTKDRCLINLATALVILFNFPGLLLYFLWRPPTFKELEQAKMEEEMMRLELEQLRGWKETKKA